MFELLLVSFLWAFSFGLIKTSLAGVDPTLVAFLRLFISFLVFLPFVRPRQVTRGLALRLALAGAIQFGVMYVAYQNAFRYLQSYEVALFTIFTPIYVTILNDAAQRRFERLHLIAAVMAVAGTAIVQGLRMLRSDVLLGFLIVQASNLCFAFGQVYYRNLLAEHPQLKDRVIFALPYLGAALASLLAALVLVDFSKVSLTMPQALTLLYLGAVSSGFGFFLFNSGARKVNPGTLAVFNDLKIPLAVTVSLLVFHEQASLPNLLAGGGTVLAALILNEIGHRIRSIKTQLVEG